MVVVRARSATVAGVALFLVLLMVGMEAAGQDWPQFRGPNRDDISSETGLLKSWPRTGPKLLWTAKNMGVGYGTVSVAGGLIYTAGDVGANAVVTALDLSGQIKWQTPFGRAYKNNRGNGPRATPTVDSGKVYAFSGQGDVACLDAKSGKKIWSFNMLRKFDGKNTTWGVAESLLVDGNNVICCPGRNTTMVALDKNTGETVWKCKGIGEVTGYASPILFEYKGLRQIVTMTGKSAIGVNADTGELLWRFPRATKYQANIATPIYHDGHVFFDSGYGFGGELLKLDVKGKKASVEQVWRTDVDNHHGGVVLVDGYLYATRSKRDWSCLDFKTGEEKYRERGIGKGSVTVADGMLYCLNERGTVGLVKATPDAHKVISRFRIPKGGKGPTWAHPVVCGGRLYVRHGDLLFAYDIKAK